MKKEVSKFMKSKYHQYRVSDMYSLYDKYKQPSDAKLLAYDYCADLCRDFNGRCLKVVGGNSMQFSAGFVGEIDGEEAYFHITKAYDRYIPLKELV